MKTLEFKTISPFFELCRDGMKPFDIRLIDSKDKRFRVLFQFRSDRFKKFWLVRFINPATSESFTRELIDWDYIRDPDGFLVKPEWVILYLGEIVEVEGG